MNTLFSRKNNLALSASIALCAAMMPVSASAQTPYNQMPAGEYELDENHASLTWKVSHLGLSNYTARFTDFDAEFTFDPQNPAASVVTAEIDPMSIETDYHDNGDVDFNKKLATDPAWFNAENFPDIKFKSTSLEMTEDSTGVLKGDLEFLGVTKPVELDVTLNGAMLENPFSKKAVMGFSAKGSIKRSDWGMNSYLPDIGDAVEILIEAEFVKED
jgi:polyisoprenoid-binding protein YceI